MGEGEKDELFLEKLSAAEGKGERKGLTDLIICSEPLFTLTRVY